MVRLDIDKLYWDYLEGNPTEFIAIDLIDERYNFCKIGDSVL